MEVVIVFWELFVVGVEVVLVYRWSGRLVFDYELFLFIIVFLFMKDVWVILLLDGGWYNVERLLISCLLGYVDEKWFRGYFKGGDGWLVMVVDFGWEWVVCLWFGFRFLLRKSYRYYFICFFLMVGL